MVSKEQDKKKPHFCSFSICCNFFLNRELISGDTACSFFSVGLNYFTNTKMLHDEYCN